MGYIGEKRRPMCGMTQCWGNIDVFQLAPKITWFYRRVSWAAELQLGNTGLLALLNGMLGLGSEAIDTSEGRCSGQFYFFEEYG